MTKPIHFENILGELEGLVQHLVKGDLSLEQSLKQFEKGISLARQCQNTLTQAEQKVASLTLDQSPNSTTSDE